MFLCSYVLILLVTPGGTFWLISCQILSMVIVWGVHSLKKPKQRFWNSAAYDINHFIVVASPCLLAKFWLTGLRKRGIFSNYVPESLTNYCIITQLCHQNLMIICWLKFKRCERIAICFPQHAWNFIHMIPKNLCCLKNYLKLVC